MKLGRELPILGVLVVVVLARLFLRRRRGAETAPTRREPGRSLRLGAAFSLVAALFGDAGLVASREIKERARGRLFRLGTLAVLVIVALAIGLSTLSHHKRPVVDVALVNVPARLHAPIVASGAAAGMTVRLSELASPQAAAAALRAGTVAIAVEGTDRIVVNKSLGTASTSAADQLARALSSELGAQDAIRAAGLSAAQAAALARARPVPIVSLAKSTNTSEQVASLIGLPLLFFMFIQYNTWTLLGVMEEESTRVVEVLLAAVRPTALLTGKVLGIGVLALVQAGLIVGVALSVAKATGSTLAKGTTPSFLAAIVIWLLVGYAFYAWVYAAAGSMAERRDQVQAIALPLSVPIAIGYVVGIIAQASANASLVTKVLAYLPPTAPFAMPALVGLNAVSWWQVLASVLISVVCTIGVARLAAVIYRRAILRTGRRVGLREVLRRERVRAA
ncbi:MAG: ABC transporter permease [Actinomycetota bacterium]|nr:ABC transporter permease [Actinomycetota bacterium]